MAHRVIGGISYWTLDESSGPAADSIGTNNLSEINGPVSSAAGIINGGRRFNSANNHVLQVADSPSVSVGDIDFTFSAWVNYVSLAVGTNPADIISKDAGSGSEREYLLSYNNAVERLRFGVFSPAGAFTQVIANAFGRPALDTWIFVVAWHDSVNDQLGIQVNNGTPDFLSYGGGGRDTDAAFTIGGRSNAQFLTNGIVDEVGFWKRILTSDERASLYNGGAGSRPQFSNAGTGRRRLEAHRRSFQEGRV